MKKVVITGAKGTIGTVLMNGLKGYYGITSADLPETDARDYGRLLEIFPGHDDIIHLAWNLEDFRTGKAHPDNSIMFRNVYRAAVEAKVPRIIMASSVHADEYYRWKGPGMLKPDKVPVPDSPYGADKVFMESLGRYYAKNHGLEVVCTRFGGVRPDDRIDTSEEGYEKVWLSHRDCVELIRACIDAPKIPGNFLIVYGVSNNSGRIHDYSNPLGWIPKDNSAKIKK